MGNNPSVPVNEAVYLAAKSGRVRELDSLLRNARPETSPGNLLEWQDGEGRTAIILASAKDHVDCVELLLRYRANVQHMSRRREGGTALHEAVFRQCNRGIIENLLRYGASPFVENISRYTPVDYAIVRRDAGLLRRLERCGYFCQYMNVRVLRALGFSKGWAPRWVVVFPRYGCPLHPQQPIRRLLLIYTDARSYDPICKIYLDGSTVQQVIGDNGQPQALLALHRTHVQPKAVAPSKDSAGHWLINFRPAQNNADDVTNLIQAMNAQHVLSPQPPMEEGDEALARRIQRQGSVGESPMHGSTDSGRPPIRSAFSVPQMPPQQPYPPLRQQTLLECCLCRRDMETQSAEEDDEAPSAPPLPPEYYESAAREMTAEPAFDQLGQDSKELVEDEGLCVVCLENPKTCGFVHGSSMHRCVCKKCALELQQNGNGLCPICRQPIETVPSSRDNTLECVCACKLHSLKRF